MLKSKSMKWGNDELNSVPDSYVYRFHLYPSTNLSNTTVSVISSTVDIHASMYTINEASTIRALFKTMLYFGMQGPAKYMGLT